MVWCKAYFDILSRLGVTHECDRRTDERTDILVANAVLNYVAPPIQEASGPSYWRYTSVGPKRNYCRGWAPRAPYGLTPLGLQTQFKCGTNPPP